jgi:hypothetical protein
MLGAGGAVALPTAVRQRHACTRKQTFSEALRACDGAEHRLYAPRLQLTAIKQQYELRSGRFTGPDERRQPAQRINDPGNRGERRDKVGPSLIELSPDLAFTRWRQQWPPPDLRQIHSHQVDVRALNALLGGFDRKILGTEVDLIPIGEHLWYERLRVLDGNQLLGCPVEDFLVHVLAGIWIRWAMKAEAVGAPSPVEHVQLRRRLFPLH